MDKIKLSLLNFKLVDKNIRFISIYYHGGGDEGSIENIQAYTLEEILEIMIWEDLPENYLSELSSSILVHGRSMECSFTLEDEEKKIIEDIAYEKLEKVEDWYNDDGGYGNIMIDMKTNDYDITNKVYYTNTESYKHNGSFL